MFLKLLNESRQFFKLEVNLFGKTQMYFDDLLATVFSCRWKTRIDWVTGIRLWRFSGRRFVLTVVQKNVRHGRTRSRPLSDCERTGGRTRRTCVRERRPTKRRPRLASFSKRRRSNEASVVETRRSERWWLRRLPRWFRRRLKIFWIRFVKQDNPPSFDTSLL